MMAKKSLKIPEGSSESVYRRTDNTIAKRTNTDLQNITYKTKDRVTRTPLKTRGELSRLCLIFINDYLI
jgi:hypothetical protein